MTTRQRQRYVLGAAIVLVLALLIAPAAAGRGRASIWMESDGARTSGDVAYGSVVSFGFTSSYSDPTGGTGPWLQVLCYQNGYLVFSDGRAGFEGGIDYGVPFVLGGSVGWQSGAADCTASVGHVDRKGKFVADATMNFHVAA